MNTFDVLAIDLGASNGRGIIGSFDGNKLALKETHRFTHQAVSLNGHHYWDFLNIYNNVISCIKSAVKDDDKYIRSIGIDSWAQDYGLLDADRNLLGLVHTYRDTRTTDMPKKLMKKYSPQQIFNMTGICYNNICTLFQMMSMLEYEQVSIKNAKSFLFLADLINFYLSGYQGCNTSVASLSLMYDPFIKNWNTSLIDEMGLPNIFPQLVNPGTTIGKLNSEIVSGTDRDDLDICAVTSHDTISALDFIPDKGRRFIISSGTWSVAGHRISKPNISTEAYEGNFISELGYNGQFYLLRNITGLWIIQEVMREWNDEGFRADFNTLNAAALKSDYQGFIDVDSTEFALPGDMQGKIFRYVKSTGQTLPANRIETYRCILLGLAFKYKQTLDNLERINQEKFEAINIVGGGAKNTALNSLVADLCGIPVLAGPYEATAIGNMLCQLIAQNEISGSLQACEIVERSGDIKEYHPKNLPRITELYNLYLSL